MSRSWSLRAPLTTALLYLASPAGLAATLPQQSAQAMIEHTTNQVLRRLNTNRAILQAHPGKVHLLIENQVLPHFDFQRMARWVLGRYWRTASTAQRAQFIEQFEELLINTYGSALLGYSGQTISYEPNRGNPGSGEVTVRTEIHDPNGGPNIPINYRVYNDHGQWKVFDLSVDGVSLLTNYRESFGYEVQSNGMNGLIRVMEQHNRKVAG